MAVTMEQVMRECNNFFENCKYTGVVSISGGKLVPDVGAPYVYVAGSKALSGVYSLADGRFEDADVMDEEFSGTLWYLYPPKAFTDIVKEMAEFEARSPAGGFVSESFGQYSYSRATGSKGVLTAQEAFADRLRPYRRMYTEVG